VHPGFEIEPFQAWYYQNFPNFFTLVILLQVDLTFTDEPKTIYEGFYEIKDTSIFSWSSILNIGHYHWLCRPICQLLPNSKVNYLVCTI
jgi:hypothetical protein